MTDRAPQQTTTRRLWKSGIAIMLCMFLVLAMMRSEAMVQYTMDFQSGPVTGLMVRSAQGWHALMERLGLAALSQSARDFMDDITSAD